MNLKLIAKVVGVILTVYAAVTQAANLLSVYGDAVQNDPTFKKAEATWQSEKQNLGIAWSSYLPQVDVTGGVFKQYQRTLPISIQNQNINGYNNLYAYQISATQPIFNAPNWFNIKSAKASVKAATAQYSLAAQDLMVRTATAYFEVLKAYDALQTTIAKKKAFYREYITQQQKFKVGLIAITGVYEAQASYDQSIADEINDRNTLYNRIEDLRAITGKHYANLTGLANQVPLIVPAPNNINVWVSTAEGQNYTLLSDEFLLQAAHQNVLSSATGSLPQISAQAQYGQTITDGHRNLLVANRIQRDSGEVGLALNFPVIQGGFVVFNTRQAAYDYAAQGAQLQFDHRTIVNNTRQSFLGILTGISQVKADKQAIASGKNALKATQAGYSVGTRTILDVLNEVSSLAVSVQRYYDDQYNYIISIINLKYAAGTLSPQDLAQINAWLNKQFNFNLPAKLFNVHSAPVLVAPTVKRQKVMVYPLKQREYAIQVYSSVDKNHAKQFIHRCPKLNEKLHIIKVGRYYKVVYGNYKNYSTAKAVAVKLQRDPKFKGVKPWVIAIKPY